MSLEQSIDKLTAAIEAATGVLVALGVSGKAATTPPAASAPAPRAGRPPKAAPAPAPAPADEGFGGDDGGLGGDDGGLGDDDADATTPAGATPEEAKAAVLAYRDKAIKVKGKDEGINLTRQLMKKYVAALDDINEANAVEIHKAFTAAVGKIK